LGLGARDDAGWALLLFGDRGGPEPLELIDTRKPANALELQAAIYIELAFRRVGITQLL